MNILKELFGGSSLVEAVGSLADRFIQTKEEKQAFKLELRKLSQQAGLEADRIAAADRANARNREVQLRNTIGVYVQNIAAVAIICTFCVLLFLLVFRQQEILNKEMVYALLGALGTLVTGLFSFWFGSSEGSRKKDITLLEMQERRTEKQLAAEWQSNIQKEIT